MTPKKKHLYCCQNTAQNFLYHFVSVPDDFKVKASCLRGTTKEEFIEGLKELTAIVKKMYADMIARPFKYALPMVEDKEYKPYNHKAGASGRAPRRLVILLHLLANCGKLKNGKIEVMKNDFLKGVSQLESEYKIAGYDAILERMRVTGHFAIEGLNGKVRDEECVKLTISHRNSLVVPALYRYMRNTPLKKNAIFSLNYNLMIAKKDLPKNYRQAIFLEYLSREDRKFFNKLDGFLMSQDVALGDSEDFDHTSYNMEYAISKKGARRIAHCFAYYGMLRVALKMNYIQNYTAYLETLPEHIKKVFRTNMNCNCGKASCVARSEWVFEGKQRTTCGYRAYVYVPCNNLNDLEYYKRIISEEITEEKKRVKEGTNVIYKNKYR